MRSAFADIPVKLAAGLPGPAPLGPTLVVASDDGAGDIRLWLELWRTRPDVAVLVIEPGGGDGSLLQVLPHRRRLGVLTDAKLRAAAGSVLAWGERLAVAEVTGDSGVD